VHYLPYHACLKLESCKHNVISVYSGCLCNQRLQLTLAFPGIAKTPETEDQIQQPHYYLHELADLSEIGREEESAIAEVHDGHYHG